MFPHKQILCPTFSLLGSHHLLIHDGSCQENTLLFGIFKRKLPTQDQGQSDSWPNKWSIVYEHWGAWHQMTVHCKCQWWISFMQIQNLLLFVVVFVNFYLFLTVAVRSWTINQAYEWIKLYSFLEDWYFLIIWHIFKIILRLKIYKTISDLQSKTDW